MPLNLHIQPYIKDQYGMGEKYYRWSYMFGSLVLKNSGIQDLQQKTPARYETMMRKFYYATMSDDELKVMLQGVFPTRPENYDPKKFFRPPIQAGVGRT